MGIVLFLFGGQFDQVVDAQDRDGRFRRKLEALDLTHGRFQYACLLVVPYRLLKQIEAHPAHHNHACTSKMYAYTQHTHTALQQTHVLLHTHVHVHTVIITRTFHSPLQVLPLSHGLRGIMEGPELSHQIS